MGKKLRKLVKKAKKNNICREIVEKEKDVFGDFLIKIGNILKEKDRKR